jgi:SH3-like domain-containing protein
MGRGLMVVIRRVAMVLAAVALAMLVPPPAGARDQGGLPVPRFVSLHANKIFLRSGPGMNFPVQWVYQRHHMPVEVIAEYDTWRKIRDWQGTVGWVHQSMLDGGRYALITGAERDLLQDPQEGAPPTARLMPGVVAELLRCQGAWCRLKAEGYKGWVRRSAFYGVYPDEKVE